MTKKEKTRDAVAILHGRYVKDDPQRKAAIEAERVNAEVARLIFNLRKEAGLTQGDLAQMLGTTQSVISRLEDAEYDGHSLTMLSRIAEALNQRLTVVMTAQEPAEAAVRRSFRLFVQMSRRARGLTPEQLAKKLETTPEEVAAMERNPAYRPSPLMLHRLSKFTGVPDRRLAELVGAIKQVSDDVRHEASRFAAQSDSFAKLTKEERKILDDFMRFLRDEKLR